MKEGVRERGLETSKLDAADVLCGGREVLAAAKAQLLHAKASESTADIKGERDSPRLPFSELSIHSPIHRPVSGGRGVPGLDAIAAAALGQQASSPPLRCDLPLSDSSSGGDTSAAISNVALGTPTLKKRKMRRSETTGNLPNMASASMDSAINPGKLLPVPEVPLPSDGTPHAVRTPPQAPLKADGAWTVAVNQALQSTSFSFLSPPSLQINLADTRAVKAPRRNQSAPELLGHNIKIGGELSLPLGHGVSPVGPVKSAVQVAQPGAFLSPTRPVREWPARHHGLGADPEVMHMEQAAMSMEPTVSCPMEPTVSCPMEPTVSVSCPMEPTAPTSTLIPPLPAQSGAPLAPAIVVAPAPRPGLPVDLAVPVAPESSTCTPIAAPTSVPSRKPGKSGYRVLMDCRHIGCSAKLVVNGVDKKVEGVHSHVLCQRGCWTCRNFVDVYMNSNAQSNNAVPLNSSLIWHQNLN